MNNNNSGTVYLIPAPLASEGTNGISPEIKEAIAQCQVFFTENEKDTRRYFKKLLKEMVIDDYEWHAIHGREEEAGIEFRKRLSEGKIIGIVSDAGCPGVADPGQLLVAIAQESSARIIPLVGPSSILLALMASGMNGQRFYFHGYLPIEPGERGQMIRQLETHSARENCTEIFIETPYRNNQMLEALLQHGKPETRICIAASLTDKEEWVKTKKVKDWKREKPDLHKKPVIFLLQA